MDSRLQDSLLMTKKKETSKTTSFIQNCYSVRNFVILWTCNLTQKSKSWNDGYMSFHTFNSKCIVYDEMRNPIAEAFITESKVLNTKPNVRISSVLITIEDEVLSSTTDITPVIARPKKHIPKNQKTQHHSVSVSKQSTNHIDSPSISIAHQIVTSRSRVPSNSPKFSKGSPPIALSTPASLAPFKLPLKFPNVSKHKYGLNKHHETHAISKASVSHKRSATRHLNSTLNHIPNPPSPVIPELHSTIESSRRKKSVSNCHSLNNSRTKECMSSFEKASLLDESVSLKVFNPESDKELEIILADSFDTTTELKSNTNINTTEIGDVSIPFEDPDMTQKPTLLNDMEKVIETRLSDDYENRISGSNTIPCEFETNRKPDQATDCVDTRNLPAESIPSTSIFKTNAENVLEIPNSSNELISNPFRKSTSASSFGKLLSARRAFRAHPTNPIASSDCISSNQTLQENVNSSLPVLFSSSFIARPGKTAGRFKNNSPISNTISAKAVITKSSDKNPDHKYSSAVRPSSTTTISVFNSPDQIPCPNGEAQCSSENRRSVNDDICFPIKPDPLNHPPIYDNDADKKSDRKSDVSTTAESIVFSNVRLQQGSISYDHSLISKPLHADSCDDANSTKTRKRENSASFLDNPDQVKRTRNRFFESTENETLLPDDSGALENTGKESAISEFCESVSIENTKSKINLDTGQVIADLGNVSIEQLSSSKEKKDDCIEKKKNPRISQESSKAGSFPEFNLSNDRINGQCEMRDFSLNDMDSSSFNSYPFSQSIDSLQIKSHAGANDVTKVEQSAKPHQHNRVDAIENFVSDSHSGELHYETIFPDLGKYSANDSFKIDEELEKCLDLSMEISEEIENIELRMSQKASQCILPFPAFSSQNCRPVFDKIAEEDENNIQDSENVFRLSYDDNLLDVQEKHQNINELLIDTTDSTFKSISKEDIVASLDEKKKSVKVSSPDDCNTASNTQCSEHFEVSFRSPSFDISYSDKPSLDSFDIERTDVTNFACSNTQTSDSNLEANPNHLKGVSKTSEVRLLGRPQKNIPSIQVRLRNQFKERIQTSISNTTESTLEGTNITRFNGKTRQPLYRQGPPPDNSVDSVTAQRSNSIKLYEEEGYKQAVHTEPENSCRREKSSCLLQFPEKVGFVSAKEVFSKISSSYSKTSLKGKLPLVSEDDSSQNSKSVKLKADWKSSQKNEYPNDTSVPDLAPGIIDMQNPLQFTTQQSSSDSQIVLLREFGPWTAESLELFDWRPKHLKYAP